MIIYKITNMTNGKIYIGQTIRNLDVRKAEHKSSALNSDKNYPLYNAMVKYGFDNFSFEVIDTAESTEQLNIAEQKWIAQLNTISPNGYNLENGGLNKTVAEESRQKMSKARLALGIRKEKHPNWGKHFSEETCRKIGEGNRGKIISEENKALYSKLFSGNGNPFFGKIHTDETKKKISKANSKRIYCITNDTTYNSATEAASTLNLWMSEVCKVAVGTRKHTKGFRFKYL
jgi:group I intron endonuclease